MAFRTFFAAPHAFIVDSHKEPVPLGATHGNLASNAFVKAHSI
jgi:hypothetical protein